MAVHGRNLEFRWLGLPEQFDDVDVNVLDLRQPPVRYAKRFAALPDHRHAGLQQQVTSTRLRKSLWRNPDSDVACERVGERLCSAIHHPPRERSSLTLAVFIGGGFWIELLFGPCAIWRVIMPRPGAILPMRGGAEP